MFYYLYKDSDKSLISESSELITPKAGYSVAEFDDRQVGIWNGETLSFDAYPANRVISIDEFLERFTATEQEDIIEAAKTSKKANRFITILKIVQAANLDAEFIQTSVNAMESAGVIGAGRAAEVLA